MCTWTMNTRRKTKALGLVLPTLFKDGRSDIISTLNSHTYKKGKNCNTCDNPDDCVDSRDLQAAQSEMSDGSGGEMFSCQSSVSGSLRSTGKDAEVRQQMEQETWVQCDEIHCQKWRRVRSLTVCDLTDSKWFCSMNPDPQHNACSKPEEDYALYDKLARKIGLKYVFSELEEGTLVWAKVIGYCRWPAVVTKDPACGFSVDTDQDEDPLFYHVEFLGEPHSHGWVRSHFVTVYGHKQSEHPRDTEPSSTSATQGDMGRGQRGKYPIKRRGKRLRTETQRADLKKYKKQSVDVAVEEAEAMFGWTEAERLNTCVFKQITEIQDCSGAGSYHVFDYVEDDGPAERPKAEVGANRHGKARQSKAKGTKRSRCIRAEQREFRSDREHRAGNSCPQQQAGSSPASRRKSKGQTTPANTSSAGSSLCPFSSSLVDKSKEEKLTFDVQMYRRNEKAFAHDVYRFMVRQGMKMGPRPVWQHTPVTLFQLFITVFEQGGYHQVCKERGWTRVYREVTNHPSSTGGSRAKAYYLRNLLPYECYLRGWDYQHLMTEAATDTRTRGDSVCLYPSQGEERDEPDRAMSSSSESSEDLEAMLTALEEASHLLQFEEEPPEPAGSPLPHVRPPLAVRGLDILFYDDSPDNDLSPGIKLADTASEFGLPNAPGDCPPGCVVDQAVPVSDEDSEVGSAGDLLEELQNVQQKINLLEDHLMVEE